MEALEELTETPKARPRELRFASITPRDRGLCKPLYGGSKKIMYYGICKRMGCRNCLAVTVPGHRDSEDRSIAERALEANGWRRSEFDGKWLCEQHQ